MFPILSARLRALTLAALAAAGAACSDATGPDAPLTPSPSAVVVERSGSGLQQRITASPGRVAVGDTVSFRSVLTNTGSAPVRVEHVVCGIDFDRTPVLDNPFIHCAAYSITTTLAPGDSVVQSDRRVVVARPGEYVIRAKQLLQPTTWWVDVPLTVVAR
jgi:hypothetical protein